MTKKECESRGKTIAPKAKARADTPAPSANAPDASAETGRAGRTRPAAAGAAGGHGLRLHRQQALALQSLARELAGAADRFRLFPRLLFRWLFVMAAKLHLAENTLALHLLFQRLEGLVDIVVANENLHASSYFVRSVECARYVG